MARRAAKPRVEASQRPAAASPWRFVLCGAIAWLLLFACFFFTRTLQNNGNLAGDGQFDRVRLTFLLPDASVLLTGNEDAHSGLRYLPQRLDLIATAAMVWAGTWGIGGLLLRSLGLGSPPKTVLAFGQLRGKVATTRQEQPEPSSRRIDGILDGAVERLVVTFGLGLSAWSLITLGLGLSGVLSSPVFTVILTVSALVEAGLTVRDRRSRVKVIRVSGTGSRRGFVVACLAVMSLFVALAFLAAMLPPFDFDVKEYHLGGPKEWYLDNRVRFLPHNVYTSFPFLTEMLSLSAMVVYGDWFRGALAGQLLLAGFLPLTAATVYAVGRRLFGTTAGLLGAVVYVTTPWAYRISVIAYAEGGLACYLALSLLAAVVAIERIREGAASRPAVLLAGLFAGSAMACKYPGLVQVVAPIGLAAAGAARWGRITPVEQAVPRATGVPAHWASSGPELSPERSRSPISRVARVAVIYCFGLIVAVGPWLAKNTIETGNPVYPLLWTIFGGQDWDAASNDKWRAGHSPSHHDPGAFFTDAIGVVASSDWQSLLVFGLAPLALLARNRQAAAWVWGYVGYLYVTWWVLTHRIDRFWVPMLPAVCVLAGAGAAWAEDLPRRIRNEAYGTTLRSLWRAACGLAFAVAVGLNLGIVTSPLSGNPSYLGDLDSVAKAVKTPHLAALERTVPPGSKVLLVGEAAIFDARLPVLYNTVFDHNLFEDWTRDQAADEVRRAFAERGVTHVAVNWLEVLRYRTTYGFTPYVTPGRFDELRREGVLGEPMALNAVPASRLSGQTATEAEREFPTLFRGAGEGRILVSEQVYPVVSPGPVK